MGGILCALTAYQLCAYDYTSLVFVGIITQLFAACGVFFFLRQIIHNMGFFKQRMIDLRGEFFFTDYDPETKKEEIKTTHQAPFIYNLERERKMKIWHPFINLLFAELVGDVVGKD